MNGRYVAMGSDSPSPERDAPARAERSAVGPFPTAHSSGVSPVGGTLPQVGVDHSVDRRLGHRTRRQTVLAGSRAGQDNRTQLLLRNA